MAERLKDYSNFTGAFFSGAFLAGAFFTGAFLAGVFFTGAFLTGAFAAGLVPELAGDDTDFFAFNASTAFLSASFAFANSTFNLTI
ncbi:MAG: pentapeptide repeat-containing protein [Bacteroidota bacterium]